MVNQQIQSFNSFIQNSIADVVKENQSNSVLVDRQFVPGIMDDEDNICYVVKFGQVYTYNKPTLEGTHRDGIQREIYPYFPHEARIRNLTYQIESEVDVHIEKRKRVKKTPTDLIEEFPTKRVKLGKIPVMIRSCQCHLSDCNDQGIIRNKECSYDQGGYFIINGSEKVIVAQER